MKYKLDLQFFADEGVPFEVLPTPPFSLVTYDIKNLGTYVNRTPITVGWSAGNPIIATLEYIGGELEVTTTRRGNNFALISDVDDSFSLDDILYIDFTFSSEQYAFERVSVTGNHDFLQNTTAGKTETSQTLANYSGHINIAFVADTLIARAKVTLHEFKVVNLTQIFGKGKEPTLAWCKTNIKPSPHPLDYVGGNTGFRYVKGTQGINNVLANGEYSMTFTVKAISNARVDGELFKNNESRTVKKNVTATKGSYVLNLSGEMVITVSFGPKITGPVITTETEVSKNVIPFETEYVDDSKLDKGTEVVRVQGKNGLKTFTWVYTYTDGILTDTTEDIKIDDPINKVIARGTRDAQAGTIIETEVSETVIPFETQYINDSTLDEGKTELRVKGKNGLKTITWTYTFNDISWELISTKEDVKIVNPVTEVIARGTKSTASYETMANEIRAMIRSIPNAPDVTIEDKPQIILVRQAYDKLPAEAKELVQNYQGLLNREQAIREIEALPQITTETEVVEKAIPFETKNINDNKLDKGKTQVRVKGKNGLRTTTFVYTFKDGVLIDTTEDVKILEPTTEIIAIGTLTLVSEFEIRDSRGRVIKILLPQNLNPGPYRMKLNIPKNMVPPLTLNTISLDSHELLGVKLEHGTVGTDWTPAPEDAVEEARLTLEAAKKDAKEKADAARDAAKNYADKQDAVIQGQVDEAAEADVVTQKEIETTHASVTEMEAQVRTLVTSEEYLEDMNGVKSDISTNASEINALPDKITQQVSESFASKEDLTDYLLSTEYEQTSSAFEFNFNQSLDAGISAVEGQIENELEIIHGYIRMEDDERGTPAAKRKGPRIVVGQAGSETTLKIYKDRISFLQGDTEVAYISGQSLYIEEGIFLEEVIIGDFGFVPRPNGNLSFLKIGGI